MGIVPAEVNPLWNGPYQEVAVLETKRIFNPGEGVMDLQGQRGLVLSPEGFQKVRPRYPEGRRPGSFFAPGCCPKPDYLTQVPVLFEDGTYDVMKVMNLRKDPTFSGEKKRQMLEMLG